MIIIQDKFYHEVFIDMFPKESIFVENAKAIDKVSLSLPLIYNRYIEGSKLREYVHLKKQIMTHSIFYQVLDEQDNLRQYLIQSTYFSGDEDYYYCYELIPEE